MKKWRVWCETESLHVSVWAADKPTTCPNDGGHTITAAKTCIINDCYCKRTSEVDEETGTSYTLAIEDSNRYKRHTNASPISVTVPPFSEVAFPKGTEILGDQGGAGQVTIVEGSGVIVNGDKKAKGQNSGWALINIDEDVWDLHGDMEA